MILLDASLRISIVAAIARVDPDGHARSRERRAPCGLDGRADGDAADAGAAVDRADICRAGACAAVAVPAAHVGAA